MSKLLKTLLLGLVLVTSITACKKFEQATEGSAQEAKDAAIELKEKTVDAAKDAAAATEQAAKDTAKATGEAAEEMKDVAKEKIDEVKAAN